MKASYVAFCAFALVFLVAGANVAEAACNPNDLRPCAGPISSGGAPNAACCSKIKAQKPCFCQYLKDPNLSKIVSSPNAQRVAKACGVSIPKC